MLSDYTGCTFRKSNILSGGPFFNFSGGASMSAKKNPLIVEAVEIHSTKRLSQTLSVTNFLVVICCREFSNHHFDPLCDHSAGIRMIASAKSG